MKHVVSKPIFITAKKLLKEGKIVPLVKFRIDPHIKVGDVINLKGKTTLPSIRVKIIDIKEYVINLDDASTIPEEIRTFYGDLKLKNLLNSDKVKKIYVIYVKLYNKG